ncbi:MAG: tRNA lysidine(34) synthetase TilS [Rhodocyclaceae bacterium]|nr:tRNA lysidine(34) synthetase TilS [Rhodocyclaceae bacterium]
MAASRKSRPADPPGALRACLGRHPIDGLRVCVALSGGVDSVVLLHALQRHCRPGSTDLSACHVDHGLSPDAGRWVEFCRTLCARLGVPLTIRPVRVERDGEGLEAAARHARMAALAAQPADVVVLAHHADDQAETVLYRLFRGAGLRGAGAMREFEGRDGAPSLLRPMLALSRAEIEAWARREGLAWVEDASNRSADFDRNYIRHELIAGIRRRFPAATERLAAAAEQFREGDALLDRLAAIDWLRLGGGAVAASCARLAEIDGAGLCNLLRWRIHRLGHRSPARPRLREAARQLVEVPSERPLRIALGETELCRYRCEFWLQPALAAAPAESPWHGETPVDWAGGAIQFSHRIGIGLSPRALGGRLTISVRRDGDRLRTRGGGPLRDFKSLAQQTGVPPWIRTRLPVLRVDGAPCWAAELGIEASAACAADELGLVPRWQAPAGVLTRLRVVP